MVAITGEANKEACKRILRKCQHFIGWKEMSMDLMQNLLKSMEDTHWFQWYLSKARCELEAVLHNWAPGCYLTQQTVLILNGWNKKYLKQRIKLKNRLCLCNRLNLHFKSGIPIFRIKTYSSTSEWHCNS